MKISTFATGLMVSLTFGHANGMTINAAAGTVVYGTPTQTTGASETTSGPIEGPTLLPSVVAPPDPTMTLNPDNNPSDGYFIVEVTNYLGGPAGKQQYCIDDDHRIGWNRSGLTTYGVTPSTCKAMYDTPDVASIAADSHKKIGEILDAALHYGCNGDFCKAAMCQHLHTDLLSDLVPNSAEIMASVCGETVPGPPIPVPAGDNRTVAANETIFASNSIMAAMASSLLVEDVADVKAFCSEPHDAALVGLAKGIGMDASALIATVCGWNEIPAVTAIRTAFRANLTEVLYQILITATYKSTHLADVCRSLNLKNLDRALYDGSLLHQRLCD
ncbi:hypothetical protein K402DRAFT_422635 [Aulographum hederae CBS 113979]|uniref:Uncharacterized protein n=1 Tax=Aulographum hederae CBS 113979 TaxID=1176131 RepID=A0A6G1GV99_9PEZI|nr:hypothetical protein K402DRAFT_422635 [Aulographum hederae CBS 113979]